ncbi:L-asparaginase II [Aspergillus steynii IBT 23096]|uniref:L-asparaginase II n=1 Tax=Aspergillus steynii IBT 23096 TaxID=1392250 RepID=A0A2I2G4A7_9EURO|nr:L-asparaginase II [Aspergillus steynii IBT 23096]PLB47720.1 L-asparaginase II [Aspergillus steynii IBT 23096]
MQEPTDHVVTYRGEVVENRHQVHAAITDATGRLLYAVGDPTRLTLARSAAKPAQALAVLETGGLEQCGFNDADLALVCASHSSEDKHISRALAMLAKIPAAETDLRCGGHPAVSEAVNREWIKRDYTPTGVCNNCSGKHAGMLAGAKAIGAGFEGYHLPTHPMQVRVKRVVQELSGLDENEVKWSIDGCNLPAPALPLHNLARIYATIAAATDATSVRTKALAQIFRAMAGHPDLVGGEGRFCTKLMEAFQGGLIGKLGADGCYGIGIQASESTRRLGVEGAIGIAVKIEDGNIGILYSAVVEILEQLQIGTADMRHGLACFYRPRVLNTAGVVTGQTSNLFRIRAVR